MRRLVTPFIALLFLPGLLGAQLIPGAKPIDRNAMHEEFLDAVIRGVRVTATKWIAAWRDDDVLTAASLYEDRAFIMTPEGRTVSGKDSVFAYLHATLPNRGQLQTSLVEIDASGRMAMTLERYVLAAAASGGPTTEGLLLTIYKSDGRTWRIRSQVFRPDPPASGS